MIKRRAMIFLQVACVTAGIVLCAGALLAAPPPDMSTRVVAASVKAAAKAYVMASDLEQLRSRAMERLRQMKPARFHERYARAYLALKELPSRMKARYGIVERMTQAEALRRVATLKKAEACEIIDALPDAFVTAEFNRYMARENK